jgi:hypothetical protein
MYSASERMSRKMQHEDEEEQQQQQPREEERSTSRSAGSRASNGHYYDYKFANKRPSSKTLPAQKGAASSQRKARQAHFNENVHKAMEYSPGSPAAKQARASLKSFKKDFNERMAALAAASKKIPEMNDVQAATMIQRAERGKRARRLLEARKEQLRNYAKTTYICSQLRSCPPTPAATTVVEQYDSDDEKPAPIVVPHFTLGQLKQSSFFRDDGGINWDCSALSHTYVPGRCHSLHV